MPSMIRFACLLGLLVWPALAFAQDYPSRTIKFVVPFPAGGPADEVGGAARRVGENELDRPIRPALRLRPDPGGDARGQRGSRQRQELATMHRCLP